MSQEQSDLEYEISSRFNAIADALEEAAASARRHNLLGIEVRTLGVPPMMDEIKEYRKKLPQAKD
jgi:hypothetical protein